MREFSLPGLPRCHRGRFLIALFVLTPGASAQEQSESATAAAVTIRTDFPGGNAKVSDNSGNSVHLAPDLRGGRPWFYWCFEATATRPGRVRFIFPGVVAGHKNGAIGFQGPAISTDQGKTWKWMGTDRVAGRSFSYEFAKPNEPVRFAVTIPYLQPELDAFLERNAANPHLKTRALTKSRHGRDVELLQIGAPGPGVKPMLVTARHHAVESIASYVLEGFLQEAISDTPAGKAFREKHVLYAVPFVDKDGVEEGDQGKNRKPHDHNRDYGKASIYPEIRAIKKLDQEMDFGLSLDFHCPTLVMQDHQVMYFVGPKDHPKNNFENVSRFARAIKQRLPKSAPAGPMNWMRPAKTPTPMNSHYFGFKNGAIMAATIEMPFAPPGKATDPASCRKYGHVMLDAFVHTSFLASDAGEPVEGKRTDKALRDVDSSKKPAPAVKTANPLLAAERWEPDIRRYEEADAKTPPEKGQILFVGSSSIRLWKVDKSFPGRKVLNRGFGGAQTSHVLHFMERIVLKYEPRIIVFYCGDNDVANHKTPAVVFGDFRTFARRVGARLPETDIIYLPIKPSLARWKLWDKMSKANQLVRDLCSASERLHYCDTVPSLLDSKGMPKADMLHADRLHLSKAGYAVWAGLVEKQLKQLELVKE